MPDDASGWRPIESAPKDGTRIVLAEYEPGGIFHEDARWNFWMDYWRKYPVLWRKLTKGGFRYYGANSPTGGRHDLP